jgi:hypothetical protein
MGGGVSQAFDLLIDDIHAVIRRDAVEPFEDVPVVRAGLGENSGLVGAAALVTDVVNRQNWFAICLTAPGRMKGAVLPKVSEKLVMIKRCF